MQSSHDSLGEFLCFALCLDKWRRQLFTTTETLIFRIFIESLSTLTAHSNLISCEKLCLHNANFRATGSTFPRLSYLIAILVHADYMQSRTAQFFANRAHFARRVYGYRRADRVWPTTTDNSTAIHPDQFQWTDLFWTKSCVYAFDLVSRLPPPIWSAVKFIDEREIAFLTIHRRWHFDWHFWFFGFFLSPKIVEQIFGIHWAAEDVCRTMSERK